MAGWDPTSAKIPYSFYLRLALKLCVWYISYYQIHSNLKGETLFSRANIFSSGKQSPCIFPDPHLTIGDIPATVLFYF
jgi:hypothetical protein